MTLNQALTLINSRKGSGPRKVHYLACGFEALHFGTLLQAHLLEALPGDDVELLKGVYGDLRGNLDLAAASPATAAIVVIEWSDLDPRLGLRASGGWTVNVQADILQSIGGVAAQLETALARLGARMPVVVAGPGLPLVPIGNTISGHASVFELEVKQQLSALLAKLARVAGVRIANCESTEVRLDAQMELLAGFPYKLAFASDLAQSLTKVLWQKQPKKGLITDLDDTLWSGIAGEVGPGNVSWHQDSHTQIHGLYQQMLGQLAGNGVLLGICSKNERATVDEVLARPDLLVDSKAFYPVEASWGPKSQAVARILNTWNIGADSVVFIDDSPMELNEVSQAFPGITCLPFRGKEPSKMVQMLHELRNHFGKPVVGEEDLLRQASIRASAEVREMGEGAASPEFLASLEGMLSFDWKRDPSGGRALELINKTNQFNLNGKRISEGEWPGLMAGDDTICAVVSYQDRFGALGRVAVALGSKQGSRLHLSHWVMSCRAFSRKIEYHTLEVLFQRYGVETVEFDWAITERNQPLVEFLSAFGVTGSARELSREAFLSNCGPLPHKLGET